MKKKILLLILVLTGSLNSHGQSDGNHYPKSSILIAYDLSKPLFGKSNLSPDIRKKTSLKTFGPIVGYEYAFHKNWVAGLKAGLLNLDQSTVINVRDAQTGSDVSLRNEKNESVFALSVYSKLLLITEKKVKPYIGMGFGYGWNKIVQKYFQPNGEYLAEERKYGEFAFLVKGGLHCKLNQNFSFYSEVEYKALPSPFVAGIQVRLK